MAFKVVLGSEYIFPAAQWCQWEGLLKRAVTCCQTERFLFWNHSGQKAERAKECIGEEELAWSLCLHLCALEQMAAACVDIRQKFKYAAKY